MLCFYLTIELQSFIFLLNLFSRFCSIFNKLIIIYFVELHTIFIIYLQFAHWISTRALEIWRIHTLVCFWSIFWTFSVENYTRICFKKYFKKFLKSNFKIKNTQYTLINFTKKIEAVSERFKILPKSNFNQKNVHLKLII